MVMWHIEAQICRRERRGEGRSWPAATVAMVGPRPWVVGRGGEREKREKGRGGREKGAVRGEGEEGDGGRRPLSPSMGGRERTGRSEKRREGEEREGGAVRGGSKERKGEGEEREGEKRKREMVTGDHCCHRTAFDAVLTRPISLKGSPSLSSPSPLPTIHRRRQWQPATISLFPLSPHGPPSLFPLSHSLSSPFPLLATHGRRSTMATVAVATITLFPFSPSPSPLLSLVQICATLCHITIHVGPTWRPRQQR